MQIITFFQPEKLKQGSFGMPVVSGLMQAHWSNLQALDLRCSHLDSAGVMQLAMGQWPLLSTLDLSQDEQRPSLPPGCTPDLRRVTGPS